MAREVAEHQLLFHRAQARIICAQGLYALEVDRDLSDRLAAKCQRIFHQAGMVLYHQGMHLTNVDTDLYPFNYLLGLELEAQITEYLKQLFGLRWWAEPRAGNRLKRAWAEGFGWTPLTLARTFGFTNVSPVALVRRLIRDQPATAGRGPS